MSLLRRLNRAMAMFGILRLLNHSSSLAVARRGNAFSRSFGTAVPRRARGQQCPAAFSAASTNRHEGDLRQQQQRFRHRFGVVPRSMATPTRAFVTLPSGSSSISHDHEVPRWEDSSTWISSTKSKTIKKVQGLLQKRKHRLEAKQTVVEGPKMVLELLQSPSTCKLVRQVLISTAEYDANRAVYLETFSKRMAMTDSSLPDLTVYLVTPKVFQSACSDTMTTQGVVAVVDIPTFENSPDSRTNPNPLILVLDGVSDPGNVGTLIRSSVAVGVEAILLLPGCCDVWNPKAIRSAMGASFYVPEIADVSSWSNAIEQLQHEWKISQVYAATMLIEESYKSNQPDVSQTPSRASKPHYEIDWLSHPTALVIGSEGQGLSSEIRSALLDNGNSPELDIRAVHVPMQQTPGVESLNAAVCGSIIMFEYYRQLKSGRHDDHVIKA